MQHLWVRNLSAVLMEERKDSIPAARCKHGLEHNIKMCLIFRGPCIVSIFLLIYFQRDATLHSLFISGKLLYMFRVVSPPIIRSTNNCIYSVWYLLTVIATCLYCVRVGFGTIPTPHSGQLQLSHNRGRYQ